MLFEKIVFLNKSLEDYYVGKRDYLFSDLTQFAYHVKERTLTIFVSLFAAFARTEAP